MATLATVLVNDAKETGVFFRTGDFAETITFAGSSVTAQVWRDGTDEIIRENGKVDTQNVARIALSKNQVTAPAIGDVAVFDSKSWETDRILQSDAGATVVRVVEIENVRTAQPGLRNEKA